MLGLGNSISSMPYISSSAFSIADVPGIQTWLKFNEGQSDDGNRITWADSSGQGNPIDDASAGTNDRVEFTGGALHLKQDVGSTPPEANFTTEIDLTGAFTIFMVLDVADDLNAETILQGSGTNFFRMSHGDVDTRFRFKFGGVSDSIPIASTAPSTSKALFRIERDGSNNVDFFEDDTSLGGGFPKSGASGTFSIIRLGATAATAIGAKFFEVVIFNELVSDANIALIEADIKNRNSL
jgi:hypothetical protein